MQQGSTCGKTIFTDLNFFRFRGLTSNKLAYIALAELFDRFGVPKQLHRDNDKEITSAPHWKKVWEKQAGLHTIHIKPHSPWKNYAKQGVGILKRGVARLIRNTDAPPVLWEWDLDHEAKVKICTVSPIPWLQGRTLHEHITGDTTEITELVQIRWYGLVYYWIQHSFPYGKEFLGRFLGIVHNFGFDMCYFILLPQPKTG